MALPFRRTLGSISAAFALAATLAFIGPAAHAEKYASIVIDTETNTVLHARHADAPRFPASLTKVMTLYMLFDELKAGRISLDDKIPVSRTASRAAPSSLRLKPGSSISVRNAIDALVTKSANDVAVAVAESIGGSESRFATLMTVKAANLGLQKTTFVNASGLPDSRQLSTARDMALLAEAMLVNHADYYHYFSREKFTYGGRTYKNHNELLGDVEGVDGIKTGYTRASGYNLMASANRDGTRIIAIMLGGQTSKSRNSHVEALIEAAYEAVDPTDQQDIGLRTRIAFQDFTADPIHPDAAAVPTLNGKPLRRPVPANAPPPVALAKAEPPPAPAPTMTARTPIAKPTTITPAPAVRRVAAEEPAPTPPPAPTPKSEPKPVGISEVAARLPLPESIRIAGEKMSVAEYEAAQFGQ